MKTTHILFYLLLVFISPQGLIAQEPPFLNRSYKSAQLIKKYQAQLSNSGLPAISRNVGDTEIETLSARSLPTLNTFIQNPFDNTLSIDKLQTEIAELRGYNQFAEKGHTASSADSDLLAKITPSTAFQSMLIDATAKLIAEQFQESVSSVYLNKLRERIESIAGLKQLLPKTYDLLNTGHFFRFKSIGQEFRNTFEEDLKSMPGNLKNYLETNPLPEPFNKLKNHSEYKSIHFGLDAADKLANGYTVFELLNYLSIAYQDKPDFKQYYNVSKIINIIQLNLQDENKLLIPAVLKEKNNFDNIWLDFNQLQPFADKDFAKFFLGLVYQNNRPFFNTLLQGQTTLLNESTPLFDNLKTQILPLLTIITKTSSILQKDHITADDYNTTMQYFIDFLNLANKISNNSFLNNDALFIMQNVVDIHKSIVKKDYAQVIPNLIILFDKISANNEPENNPQWVILRGVLSKYGPFLSGVVIAKNSDEMKDVIKKAVLPSGSYVAKRLSLFSLTVAAHPGITLGLERLYQKTNTSYLANGNFHFTSGLTVPIGLEFTWGTRKKTTSKTSNQWEAHQVVKSTLFKHKKVVQFLSGSYCGFMLQLIDIGAVVNYRFGDPEKELPEKITFKQIFSPGLTFQLGLPKTPLTLGFGLQYTPELRQLNESGIKTSLNALRYLARITWDLPLVNIYSKTEYKKL